MTFSEIALVFRWILPLWALGWLVLPLSGRLFTALPDRGLAAGRIVALVLIGVAAFWGAATHLISLQWTPLLLILAPLAIATGWKSAHFRASLRSNWRAFLLSDAVFLLAFAAFLWVRLRHPEANDLEKPMDMALLSASMRAEFLPFQNPWFAGQDFTNYYYFGPFLGALLGRTLATPPYLAYNLVQPIFCALFLSSLWSLTAALTKSRKIGVLAMLLVGVGGHFEPLRQWSQSGHPWPLDWWKTSRVIDNTINEYPAFTLIVGDLHAHFIAFSLAATHFCVCFCLLKAQSERQRSILLLLGGALLGVFALTNTWDVPFYGILWLGCALSARKVSWTRANNFAFIVAMALVPIVALPYFLKFKAQVSGVVFNPWMPDLFSFTLLWGSWWMLGFWALTLNAGEEKPSVEAILRRLLLGIGALALLFPFVFYLRGVFGDGDLRHQDTVFKFGLQAWLLLGTGIACEAGFRFKQWWRGAKMPFRFAAVGTGGAFFGVVGLAPACVLWTRTVRDAPQDAIGKPILSLNAARFLPPEDLAGAEWLRLHARPGESVVEAVGSDGNGNPGGDYNPDFGRIAAFSGVPCVVNWPQHIAGWGAPYPEIQRRAALVHRIYESTYDSQEPAASMKKLGSTYLFLGAREWNQAAARHFELPTSGLERVRSWNGFGYVPNGAAPQILRLKP